MSKLRFKENGTGVTPYINRVADAVAPVREKILNHPVYGKIRGLDELHIFMEHHVFAVWDFMSLLKALQSAVTCVAVPWVPKGDTTNRRLINEIVLEEESDEGLNGEYVSHFELYRAAMEQCGAQTAAVDEFVRRIGEGRSVAESLLEAKVPPAAAQFVWSNWKIVQSGSIPAIASAFTFGREELIPDLFRHLIGDLKKRYPDELSIYHQYLERHIQLDEERHTPMAIRMINRICENDFDKWKEAKEAAWTALLARLALWDGVAQQLGPSSRRPE
jgi:hypothetical protein